MTQPGNFLSNRVRFTSECHLEHATLSQEIFQGGRAFQELSRAGVPSRGYEVPFWLIFRLARPLRFLRLVQRAASGDTEEADMERKFVDVGHRVETQPGPGLVSDITHAATGSGEAGRTVGAELGEAFQALKKASGAVGNGIQDRRDEVIAYARREPVAALTAAAGFGFLAGLALAIGSRAGTGDGSAWLPQLKSRRSFLGRRTGSGWRGFLRLK